MIANARGNVSFQPFALFLGIRAPCVIDLLPLEARAGARRPVSARVLFAVSPLPLLTTPARFLDKGGPDLSRRRCRAAVPAGRAATVPRGARLPRRFGTRREFGGHGVNRLRGFSHCDLACDGLEAPDPADVSRL